DFVFHLYRLPIPRYSIHWKSHTNNKFEVVPQNWRPSLGPDHIWYNWHPTWYCKTHYPERSHLPLPERNGDLGKYPNVRPCSMPYWYRSPPGHCYNSPSRSMRKYCTVLPGAFFLRRSPSPWKG